MAILVPGQSGITLDLYVKAGATLYTPSPYPTFTVRDANSALQGSGAYYGNLLSIGHFNAANFGVPSSGALGTWTITWVVGGASSVDSFTVQQPTLTDLDTTDQNIVSRIKDHIRIDIGDFQKNLFSDYQLEVYLDKAVRRLNRELGISQTVRPTGVTPGGIGTPAITPSIMIDFDQGTLFPQTDEIEDIVVLQAEVMITRSEMSALRRASAVGAGADAIVLMNAVSGIVADTGAGIMVQNADGVRVDTTSRLTSWLSNKTRLFMDEAAAREKELEKAIYKLRSDIAMNSTKVIF